MSTPPRPTSGLAIASLVCGILGWFPLPVLGSLAAVITGHFARSELRRSPERLQGDGLALAGLILGYSALAVTLLGLVLLFSLFGGLLFLGLNS